MKEGIGRGGEGKCLLLNIDTQSTLLRSIKKGEGGQICASFFQKILEVSIFVHDVHQRDDIAAKMNPMGCIDRNGKIIWQTKKSGPASQSLRKMVSIGDFGAKNAKL